ncbi:MAG: DUF1521 domain-containing protein, partial [Candidatus Competibacterales bacterium]
GGAGGAEAPAEEPAFSVSEDGKTIDLGDGYSLHIDGKYNFTVTDPEGNKARVWGDPHIDLQNAEGGSTDTDADFYKDSTLKLANGVEIHIDTEELPDGRKLTVTHGLTITKPGEDSFVQIDGMETNDPQVQLHETGGAGADAVADSRSDMTFMENGGLNSLLADINNDGAFDLVFSDDNKLTDQGKHHIIDDNDPV